MGDAPARCSLGIQKITKVSHRLFTLFLSLRNWISESGRNNDIVPKGYADARKRKRGRSLRGRKVWRLGRTGWKEGRSPGMQPEIQVEDDWSLRQDDQGKSVCGRTTSAKSGRPRQARSGKTFQVCTKMGGTLCDKRSASKWVLLPNSNGRQGLDGPHQWKMAKAIFCLENKDRWLTPFLSCLFMFPLLNIFFYSSKWLCHKKNCYVLLWVCNEKVRSISIIS